MRHIGDHKKTWCASDLNQMCFWASFANKIANVQHTQIRCVPRFWTFDHLFWIFTWQWCCHLVWLRTSTIKKSIIQLIVYNSYLASNLKQPRIDEMVTSNILQTFKSTRIPRLYNLFRIFIDCCCHCHWVTITIFAKNNN